MRLFHLSLLLCSVILVSAGAFDRSRSLSDMRGSGGSPDTESDGYVFDVDLYESIVQDLDDSCDVPPTLQVNKSGLLPDSTTACFIYSDNPLQASKDCNAVCSSNSAKSDIVDDGSTSLICWPLAYPDGACEAQLITSFNVTVGRCLCDVPVLADGNSLWTWTVMPVIGAEIDTSICQGIWAVANAFAQQGLYAMSAIGPLSEAAWTLLAGISGLTNQLNVADADIGSQFTNWLDACSPDASAEHQLLAYFDVLASVAQARGMPVGPKRPISSAQSSASASSMPPASPLSRPTASTPTATPPPSSPSSLRASPSTSAAPVPNGVCQLARRDGGRQGTEEAWSTCDQNGIIQMTSITSIIFGAEQLLVPKVCSSRWSQACAHYASVLSVSTEKGWDKLTCSDFLGSKQPSSRTRPAVTQWDYEHAASWVDPKWRPEELCDRDEYPPVYFFQDDNAVLAQTQQLIRLLPAGQNRGAGSLWQAFCWSAGLEDPVAYMGPLPTAADTVTSQDGSTTSITYIAIAVSHRPVFTITDWENYGGLNRQDWGLAENPCIPQGLVDDKYFPLMGRDPIFHAANPGAWSYDYSTTIPAAVLANAHTYNHDD